MGKFNMREFLKNAWKSAQDGHDHALEVYDIIKERKIDRRAAVVGLFGYSLGSLLLKEQQPSERKSVGDFINEVRENFPKDLQEHSFTDFLQEIENKSVSTIHVSEDTAVIIRHDGTVVHTKIPDPSVILDMVKKGTIDNKAVDVYFKKHPDMGAVDLTGVKNTIVKNWQIPAVFLSAPFAVNEIKDLIDDYKTYKKRTPEQQEQIAYHEAAHAVAAVLRPGLEKFRWVSMRPDGKTNAQADTDHRTINKKPSKEVLENEIVIDLVGHAAEVQLCGEDLPEQGGCQTSRMLAGS